MRTVPVLDFPFEADAQIAIYTGVSIDSLGRATTAGLNSLKIVGAIQTNNGASAPFQAVVRLTGITSMITDASGAIDEGDTLFPAAAGLVKTLAVADGALMRKCYGLALSPAAATAALLVDVLLQIAIASNAT